MKVKTIHSNEYKNIIDYLIKIRKLSGISQADMAKYLNLRQADISKIESKERRLDIHETFTWIDCCCSNPFIGLLEVHKIYIFTKLKGIENQNDSIL